MYSGGNRGNNLGSKVMGTSPDGSGLSNIISGGIPRPSRAGSFPARAAASAADAEMLEPYREAPFEHFGVR